jgi:hypothetical protein
LKETKPSQQTEWGLENAGVSPFQDGSEQRLFPDSFCGSESDGLGPPWSIVDEASTNYQPDWVHCWTMLTQYNPGNSSDANQKHAQRVSEGLRKFTMTALYSIV